MSVFADEHDGLLGAEQESPAIDGEVANFTGRRPLERADDAPPLEPRGMPAAPALPQGEGEQAAPARRGVFQRIGDWFGGMRSRFRNWRLRNSTSTEGSEILTRAVNEITRTEGGHTFGEDRDQIFQRMARMGLVNQDGGAQRLNRRAFRTKPMRTDADHAAARRFWQLDAQLSNIGRREDQPFTQSQRFTPQRFGIDRASEFGRAGQDFDSGVGGSRRGRILHGLKTRATVVSLMGTRAAAQAARTGKPFTGVDLGTSRQAMDRHWRRRQGLDAAETSRIAEVDDDLEDDSAVPEDQAMAVDPEA